MLVDNCYWLNYNALTTDSNFGASPSLFGSKSYFLIDNNFIVSWDNNSRL